ncbi:helix-turn-helix domain-containing protein [Rhizobium leguminosarum bv. viciae]|nr:helix-turn-helix domain-containing protein [Rhizobium leguminosarum bv. viciae]
MGKRAVALEGDPPEPVSFRTELYEEGTFFPLKRQPWGKLYFSISGVCEFDIAGERFLSPPSYGLWIPPDVAHEAWNRHAICYVSVYVERDLCADMPSVPSTLALSPLLKAILADFDSREITRPRTPEDLRLTHVLVDQIRSAQRFETYLPSSSDPILEPILAKLQANPGDRRSLSEWARQAGTTERTVARRCQSELGISFNEWRQRSRLVAALTMLEGGEPVHLIAERLGYSNASAFIAMFHRATGVSPRRAKGMSRANVYA